MGRRERGVRELAVAVVWRERGVLVFLGARTDADSLGGMLISLDGAELFSLADFEDSPVSFAIAY